MSVRVLDPTLLSGDVMAEIYRVTAACHEEANAEEPCRTPAEVETFLRHAPESDPRDYWMAEQDEKIVGFAQLSSLHGSPSGYVEILVRPDGLEPGPRAGARGRAGAA